MALSPLREQLIGKVKEGPGREAYRRMMEKIPENIKGIGGRLGPSFFIRIIKGTQRLEIQRALLTDQGLYTEDWMVGDCGAALVRMESGTHGAVHFDAKRYAGKESGDVHRIQTSYDSQTQNFSLSTDVVKPQYFNARELHLVIGNYVQAKMGDSVVEGILADEHGRLTQHLRSCLRPHEKNVESIRVLLRNRLSMLFSDTIDDQHHHIRTLFTDGSQLHLWNAATEEYENSQLSSPLPRDSNRPNIILEGLPPMAEDVIGAIRVQTDDGSWVRIEMTDLMPRCKDAQQDPLTGDLTPEGNAAKSWRIANRPRVEVGEKKSLVHTAGSCAHIDPPSLGQMGIKVINGGAKFVIESEKTRLRR